jgi:hypothetical protein
MDFVKHQQDLESALMLDASVEDLKSNKEARRCAKVIKRQGQQIARIGKIAERKDATNWKLTAMCILTILLESVPWFVPVIIAIIIIKGGK